MHIIRKFYIYFLPDELLFGRLGVLTVNLYPSHLGFSLTFLGLRFLLILERELPNLLVGSTKERKILQKGGFICLVSSGQLSISPHIPDGVGEAEDLRSSKIKTRSDESLNAKRLKYLSDNLSRREKGFPGIMVSVYRTSSTSKSVNLLKDDGASSGEKHIGGNNQVEQTDSLPEGFMADKICVPTLPWMNGEQKINKIFDKGLRRRLLGIVMQNPGMLEVLSLPGTIKSCL